MKLIARIQNNKIEPVKRENLWLINIVNEMVAAPTRKGRAISAARSSKLPFS